MKSNKIYKILYLIFLFSSISNSMPIDSNVFKYYPLKLGNSWTYISTGYQYYNRYKISVVDDSIINGKYYFLTLTQSYTGNTSYRLQRIDSLSGKLVYYSNNNGCVWSNNETVSDSLFSKKNDSCKCNNHKCTDTLISFIFGENRRTKEFSWFSGFESGFRTVYAENIGVSYMYSYGGTGGTTTFITGAYINGVLFGDTALTALNVLNSVLPNEFRLSQNYPNPFNPTTKIKFNIPSSVETSRWDVLIAIYDALGKQVKILVNQQLQPGSYEADWDASAYPSGVYYYKLEVFQAGSMRGSFTETRKMVLVK